MTTVFSHKKMSSNHEHRMNVTVVLCCLYKEYLRLDIFFIPHLVQLDIMNNTRQRFGNASSTRSNFSSNREDDGSCSRIKSYNAVGPGEHYLAISTSAYYYYNY